MSRQDTGATGEKLAAGYLKKQHYKIIQTNFRFREGEIDIVAEKKNVIVFVEVRTKTTAGFGTPEESVTNLKKQKLINSALHYLQLYNMSNRQWQIDFIGVVLDSSGKCTRLDHIQNAVGN
jgi:putative endonuclease